MPKKFQGVNTKAVEARARKAEKHAQEQQRKQQAAEDEYWRDDDKSNARKQQRKEAQEQKRQNNLNKKKLLDELYKADEELVGKSAKAPTSSKVTRADIDRIKKQEEREKAQRQEQAELEKKNISVQNEVVEENINIAVARSLADGSMVEARTVEEAISALGVKEDLERHPERRLKASYKKFEQEYMPILKAENPTMRMSQLRQILKKQWQKSPENPLNQSHTSYNAK